MKDVFGVACRFFFNIFEDTGGWGKTVVADQMNADAAHGLFGGITQIAVVVRDD